MLKLYIITPLVSTDKSLSILLDYLFLVCLLLFLFRIQTHIMEEGERFIVVCTRILYPFMIWLWVTLALPAMLTWPCRCSADSRSGAVNVFLLRSWFSWLPLLALLLLLLCLEIKHQLHVITKNRCLELSLDNEKKEITILSIIRLNMNIFRFTHCNLYLFQCTWVWLHVVLSFTSANRITIRIFQWRI
jgi:hypothetical protein